MIKYFLILSLLFINTIQSVNNALQTELLDMMQEDQAIRFEYINTNSASLLSDIKQINSKHQQRMEFIIDKYGWPDNDLVGSEGAHAAWLLVQHMDVSFQKRCIALLKQAVDQNRAEARHYAYLIDRILVNEDQKQIYGTQVNANLELLPVQNLQKLDSLRNSVGLGPIAEYLEQCKSIYKPKT